MSETSDDRAAIHPPVGETPSCVADGQFGQVDLKTLFILVFAFAVPFPWIASTYNQRRCTNELEALKAYCWHEFEDRHEDLNERYYWYRCEPWADRPRRPIHLSMTWLWEPPAPFEGSWLADQGTRDLLHRVVGVSVCRRFPSFHMMSLIARLGTVRTLEMQGSRIDANVVRGICTISTLRELDLRRCEFVAVSTNEISASLPNCRIQFN